MKRIIIYNENEKQEIICQLVTQKEINIDNIKVLQIEEKEEYRNMKNFHIENGKIIIDEVYRKELSKEEKTEKELLKAKSTIVDLQYKELLNNKEKAGR